GGNERSEADAAAGYPVALPGVDGNLDGSAADAAEPLICRCGQLIGVPQPHFEAPDLVVDQDLGLELKPVAGALRWPQHAVHWNGRFDPQVIIPVHVLEPARVRD